jgi:D-Tyr-tRNAtyr deacylase
MEVSDQLANLGAIIAGGIERNVQQTQYNNALPVMQQAFQEAMTDFDKGNSGAGFLKIMGVAMENPNNPYIQNVSQMAFTAGKLAADDFLRKQQIDVSRARSLGTPITPEEEEEFNAFGGDGGDSIIDVSGGGGGGGGVISGEDVLPEGEGAPDNEPLSNAPDMAQPVAEMVDDGYTLQPGEQSLDASFLQNYGIPVETVIGPKRFTTSESQLSQSVTLGGKQSKTKTTKPTEKNVEEETKFQEFANRIIKADKQIKGNKQLRNIVALSGNDLLNNVDLEEEGDKESGLTYSAIVRDKNGAETIENLTIDEYNALKTIKEDTTDAPGIKFIRAKQGAPEAPAPTQGGLPAAQPPPAATIPEIPEEAMALQKLVEQGQVAKAGESAKNVEKRIKDIDAQIKQLSSTTFTAYSQGGLIPVGRSTAKTPEQAQADIQKIAQLKKQKNILQGKYSSKEEVGEALQSGLLTRAQAEAILKKQFKM